MYRQIRLIQESDSIRDLTHLIHRAYRALAVRGLNFTGAYQDEAMTAKRIESGECYVFVENERMLGTITLHRHLNYDPGKEIWYSRPEVAYFGQLAVEPDRQKEGIASALMKFVESRALAMGAAELALDTAENAEELVRFYARRGYHFIEFIQHEGKTYRSVILSKRLVHEAGLSEGLQ